MLNHQSSAKSAKKYELLIFDWDGTLMDSMMHIVRCTQAIAQEIGLPTPEESTIRQGIGLGFLDQFNRLFPNITDDKQKQDFRQRFETRFYTLCQATKPTLVKDAKLLLSYLKQQGFLLAIATSMQHKLLTQLLDQLNMKHLFEAICCGDQAIPKPHPQMLFSILNQLKIVGKQALMIGDTEYDMYMAERAGIDCLAVSYGVHKPERLVTYHPIACIDTLNDLVKHVFFDHAE